MEHAKCMLLNGQPSNNWLPFLLPIIAALLLYKGVEWLIAKRKRKKEASGDIAQPVEE